MTVAVARLVPSGGTHSSGVNPSRSATGGDGGVGGDGAGNNGGDGGAAGQCPVAGVNDAIAGLAQNGGDGQPGVPLGTGVTALPAPPSP